MDPKVIAAIRVLLEKTEWYCDEGPPGEGWSSDELDGARHTVEQWVNIVDPPPPPPPPTPQEREWQEQILADVTRLLKLKS